MLVFLDIPSRQTLALNVCDTRPLADLVVQASKLLGYNIADSQTTYITGRHGLCSSEALASPLPWMSLRGRMLGGKGGFGSMLRSQGNKASANKPANYDSCRDLYGRRLKTLKEAKTIVDKLEAEEGAKEVALERRRKKIADGLKESTPKKHLFDDVEYTRNCEDIVEKTRLATRRALKRKSDSSDRSSLSLATSVVPLVPLFEGELSSNSSDEEEESKAVAKIRGKRINHYSHTPRGTCAPSVHHRSFASSMPLMQGSNVVSVSSVDELAKIKDKSLVCRQAYVDGEWVGAGSKQTFVIEDPATLEAIGSVPDMAPSDVRLAVDAATRAFAMWKHTTGKERATLLGKWHELILASKDDLARLMTLECGKALGEAQGEVAYGASYIEWFSEEAKRGYGDIVPSPIPGSRALVMKQPVGVVSIITPYNFPNAMIARKVGAALAAGCTVVVRPAHETPLSALALCELAARAGIPPGVINVVTCSAKNTPAVGLELTTNPLVRKVSFTGSTAVGKLLMGQASTTMKRVSMELGGNAPFIVFEDADIEAAAAHLLQCKFRNAGQTCVCANRIYVHDAVYDEFVGTFTALVKEKLRVGHGLAEGTTIGPMITQRGLDKVEEQVQRAVAAGATVVLGGKRLEGTQGVGKGYFFEPTVLVNVSDDVPMTCEETFGPLCPIYRFSSEDEVIHRANAVSVGLAGYFFSCDVARVFRVAEALEVGMVGANTGSIAFDAAPFGGVKESGMGREGSRFGMDDYQNIKLINLSIK
ncbi:hypothetical protein GGI20_005042 [Coemansia sp. BCRC 34301]|nr:hypothetical protein GGI20_005042 [Coemansia sp. BCRC 34301]